MSKRTIPDIREAAPQLAALAQAAFDSGMDWGDEYDTKPRAVGLLDDAAGCFLYPQEPRLRMSYGTNCDRAQWYARWEGHKAKFHDGASRLRMAQGYVFERLFLESLGGYLEKNGGPWRLKRGFAQIALALIVGEEIINGHPDAALFYEDQPYAIADCKQMKGGALSYWKEQRLPDNTWGKLTQAGNYLRAAKENLGLDFKAFVWLCSLIGAKSGRHESVAVGWATANEVAAHALEAEKVWLRVIRSPGKPLARCAGFPNAPPCFTPTGIKCGYLEWCQGDKR